MFYRFKEGRAEELSLCFDDTSEQLCVGVNNFEEIKEAVKKLIVN